VGRLSVGVDIEEVVRFEKLIRNKRFLARVYTPQEVAYCRAKKNRVQHFAVRFAAKEAVWKALSEDLRRRGQTLGHRDIGLANDPYGRPQVVLPRAFKAWIRRVSVSLSHSRRYVVAAAVFS
jgi:holo-[acyl-carrier protein] synthase